MKIAIVYDWIDKIGGVERLLLTLHEIFPDAEFYTSYYERISAPWAKDLKINTSFIQKLPSFIKKNRILSIPFYPYAFEAFDFSNFDIVISVTSSFAKAVITKPHTKHICILLTPTRYFWQDENSYIKSFFKILAAPIINDLRSWDSIISKRPDKYISISNEVKKRTKKYYQADSEVIFPPFDIHYWNKLKSNLSSYNFKDKFYNLSKKYYLIVSRMEPYKRIDLVINAFNQQSDKQLVIVGDGSKKTNLKKIAKANVVFLEGITDEHLAMLYSNAQALIMPQEEEFGYVALEAQLFLCPVLAYKKGGALETIIEGNSGLFFASQSVEDLVGTIAKFEKLSYTLKHYLKENGGKHLEKFNKKIFKDKILKIVQDK